LPEGFELADVRAFLEVWADAVVVEVGAEAAVAGPGVGQQMPDDDQDRAPTATRAPGMALAGGMLAGLFTHLAPDRYLVTTWWSSAAAHSRYVRQDVGAPRERAAAGDDISAIAGHVLELEPTWRVLPNSGSR